MSNRLINEDSPYLKQHANNPVDWYPWGEEAFRIAEYEQKPIFLSIGYSSCHWCHVMEREVFENDELAEILNKHFISIKVDREERPDIDKHFQEVYQLLNKRAGGWPTSIFLTHELKPFFAGTYIPPISKYNMMGFKELMDILIDKYQNSRDEVFNSADSIANYLNQKSSQKHTINLNENIIDKFISETENSYEPNYGGFSVAPKFPHSSQLNLLLDIYKLNSNSKALEMATHSLKNMAKGGLYDLIDGGFCRYSVDEKWLVPHFEKMGYDNGLLIETYLKAYFVTKDEFFKDIAFETIEFMRDKMMENNLFYSASDADSEGEEGKYFVYSYDEITSALEKEFSHNEMDKILKSLDISMGGNFEGQNIIRNESLNSYEWFERVKVILREIRRVKTYPFIDKKVITAWNAMMIKSLFIASRANLNYLELAQNSLEALLNKMYIDKTLFHSSLINKEPKIEAFLEDFAYLIDTLLEAYKSTLNSDYLLIAQTLSDKVIDKFYKNGKMYLSVGEFETEAEAYDSSYPSSVGILTNSLLTLGILIDDKYKELAFKILNFYSKEITNYSHACSDLTKATIRYLRDDTILKSNRENLIDNMDKIDFNNYFELILKDEEIGEFMLCNSHSCFKSANSLEEVFEK